MPFLLVWIKHRDYTKDLQKISVTSKMVPLKKLWEKKERKKIITTVTEFLK